ncbi:hypothetical protein GLT90_01225 [Nanohaloarchaea archaeon H12]|nr:hypothetical protein [Nanohaloarchaea archaeon H12]
MHVGVIPDGNRRYAEQKEISRRKAYKNAKQTVKHVTRSLKDYSEDVDSITFYLLSEENLKRDEEELETLFDLLEGNIDEIGEFLDEKEYSVNWASTNPEALPQYLKDKLADIEQKYSRGSKTVNLLISYSGKQDILEASKKLEDKGLEHTEENFSECLEIHDDIDFVIRTGDNPERECISGFPIWNSSYAEFYHIRKNFPSVSTDDVREALDHFKSLRRKKGE